MSQQSRIEKAEEVKVEDIREVRDGVFACNFMNDRGEERKDIVLFPRKIMSETGDMVHRPQFVGKYLIAVAQEDKRFRDLLLEGIAVREQELVRQSCLVEEKRNLGDVVATTGDKDVFEASCDRLDEIHEKIGDKSFREIREEMRNLREVAVSLNEESVDVEEEFLEFVGDEQPIVIEKEIDN